MKWLLPLILVGCTTTLTEDGRYERDSERAVDQDNWTLCARIYERYNRATTHYDHSHTLNTNRPTEFDLKRDLRDNQCRALIAAEHWAE